MYFITSLDIILTRETFLTTALCFDSFWRIIQFLGGLRSKDFFILDQNLCVDAKRDVATQHTRPYLVVWAFGRQCLQ